MMNQEAMARRMQSQGPQQQGGEPGEKEGSGGGVIGDTDEMLGAISQSLQQLPGGKELAGAMDELRQRFRQIIEAAQQAAQGGGAPQGQKPPQAQQPQGTQMDKSQGEPYSPAGKYA